jgi:hypothetical protein
MHLVPVLVRNEVRRRPRFHVPGVRYPGERLEWSFVNPGFKRHKRYVDSYGWADYDNAVMKGDCREVIDKGTPLKRQR